MHISKQLILTAAIVGAAATAQVLTWTDGASAVFAGSTAVTLDGAVSASTVTFDGGAVSLAGTSTTATYAASFLQTSNVVLFPNASLASVTGISGLMADAADHKTRFYFIPLVSWGAM